ncbi:MAG: UvrD-helicase domain-containing protein [Acidobacteria bacterium]|nr:UvrD-helicase domain-containing protein [Acidobacteriota bacterium]
MSEIATTPVDQAARSYATDPLHHVVLEASAGTGKTRVLVERYLALLTAGVDPRHVLAITFTRKAAAEMRERIVAELQRSHPGVWQTLRDRADEIAVSTIDAFCFSLLREFPLEAGLDPGFSLADETEVARLVETSLDRTLRECRERAPYDEGIRLVLAQMALPRLAEGLRALLARRFVAPAALRHYLGRQARHVRSEASAAEGARDALRAALPAVPGGLQAWMASGPQDVAHWTLTRIDIERLIAPSERVPMTPADVRAALDGFSRWVLTQTGAARRKPASARPTFASSSAYEVHRDGLEAVAQAVIATRRGFEASLNVLLARAIRRVFRLAHRRYLQTLMLHDALDFSEVLHRAVQLLGQMDEFSRSRFRLEARYQHVLVDEFQDTSRLQWQLVASLVHAWGDGVGLGHEGPLPPSLFLVGDRKQSIYGFRDADVGLLDEAVAFVQGLAADSAPRQAISQSFRSHPDLLAFANDLAAGMVTSRAPAAVAFRYEEDDRFPLPAGHVVGREPEPRLGLLVGEDVDACASGVAAEIVRLLDEGTITERGADAPRRVRPGDIAVLFRSRESHREFEKALSARAIPSYVYKGLGFYDSDEIKDLVALVRALAAPESNLRAAAFLRSGFVGLSDDALRRLAPELAARVWAPGADEGEFSEDDRLALAKVRAAWPQWVALVDRLPPVDVLDHVLSASAHAVTLRGHRQAQARENVKKFRGLVRRIQNRGYATMARIAAHIDRLSAGDESNAAVDAVGAVTLMTVHASKGLEFPIVFLVNMTRGTGGFPPPLRVLAGDSGEDPIVGVARYEPGATAAEQVRAREESKRLMYVAVTRARERLYLSAPAQKRGRIVAGPGSLASVCPPSLLESFSMALAGAEDVTWAGGAHLHRMRVCPDGGAVVASVEPRDVPVPVSDEVPASLQPRASGGGTPRTRVTELAARDGASSPDTGHRAPGTGQPHCGSARPVLDADLVTGRAVHRLLAHADAHDHVSMLLARIRADLGADEQMAVGDVEAFARDVVALVQNVWREDWLRLALASPRARFEFAIAYRIDDGDVVRVVRGTVDCLVPVEEGLLVLEFKTGQRRPSHQRQLDLYVDAVRTIYPGTGVRGHLVYATREPAPMTAQTLPI